MLSTRLLGVVSSHRLALVRDPDDAHLDAARRVEVPDEAAVDVVRVELRLAPERLGAFLELREMVHPALDEIADLLGR